MNFLKSLRWSLQSCEITKSGSNLVLCSGLLTTASLLAPLRYTAFPASARPLPLKSLSCIWFCFVLFLSFLMFIFERERETETEHKQGRGRERGRHRIWSRLQALSCQHRAPHRARTHKLQDHDLSWSWMPNQLSHPGTPLSCICVLY